MTTWTFWREPAFDEEYRAFWVPIRIEAPTWFLARAYAMQALETDSVLWSETREQPHLRIRWAGSDAGAHPNLHIVVEEVAGRRAA